MNARMEGHLSDVELSDLLDGVAGQEEEQHVAGCASCAARLDGWRSVSERLARLGGASSVPGRARDEAVAAAVAGAGAVSGAGPVADRTRRRGRYLVGPLAGAAAAAVVVAGLAVGVAHLGNGGPTKSAGSASRAAPRAPSSSAAGASSSGAVGSSAGAGAGSAAPAASGASTPGTRYLGQLSGPAALAAAVERVLNGAASSSAAQAAGPAAASGSPYANAPAMSPAGATPTCPDTAVLFPGSAPRLLLTASSVYRGTPAMVYAYQVGTGRRAVVVQDPGCTVLADVPLATTPAP